mgnify:CR=1 FL=1
MTLPEISGEMIGGSIRVAPELPLWIESGAARHFAIADFL